MTTQGENTSLRTVLWVAAAELILCGLMLGIYALVGHFSLRVLYSTAVGAGLSLLNFAVMTFFLYKAEHSESMEKAQLYARGTYGLRMLLLAVALIFLLKTGAFEVLATLLPLCFVRISIYLVELLRKKGEKQT